MKPESLEDLLVLFEEELDELRRVREAVTPRQELAFEAMLSKITTAREDYEEEIDLDIGEE